MGKSSSHTTEVLKKSNPSVDWNTRTNSPARRFLAFLENISLRFEQPLHWLINDPRFNPLYHTGTITIFLLLVILLTGLYLTMFYPFGFTLSYAAVANIESNFVGRIIRALHRYASDAAVIFALLHGWRTFFQDRFRGPRWLAWVTGVGMAVVTWAIGITGYWLIWDTRTQVLNQTLFNVLGDFKGGQIFIVDYMVGDAAGTGWVFMLLVITLHLGLSALVGLFLWWHLQRMSRAKWTPPPFWMAISMLVLLVAAIAFPVGVLPPINPLRLPDQTFIDLFYLFYLPTFLRGPQALFWSALVIVVGFLIALPWIMPRAKELKPVQVHLPSCDGCTLCERDCPYTAIKMIPRTDGGRPKLQAEIDPNLCVSCGVCIGSCPENAISFGEISIEPLWQSTLETVSKNKNKKVIFTCERHALMNMNALKEDELIIPLTCIAMANPSLAAKALEAGASEVQFIGCPPEDCANREGNVWMQERINGERLPKLKPEFKPSVHTAWMPPTEFKNAIKSAKESHPTAYNFIPATRHLRYIITLLVIMAVMTYAQIWLSDRPVNFFTAENALLSLQLTHHSGYPIRDLPTELEADPGLNHPTRVVVEVNGETKFDETYKVSDSRVNQGTRIFKQITLPTGEHHIRVTMYDRPDPGLSQILFDETVTLTKNQALDLNFRDVHYSSPENGRKLYFEEVSGINTGCKVCHSLDKDVTIVGPSFYGLADRAANRIPGMSAEEYIRQSILEPDAYVVPDFPKGLMVQNFIEILTENQTDDLVAFLMTLKENK